MGIGTTKECFQSVGRTPVEREELKMRERGVDIEKAVCLSIVAEIESEPADLSEGMHERRLVILSGEQSKFGGHGKGGGEGG